MLGVDFAIVENLFGPQIVNLKYMYSSLSDDTECVSFLEKLFDNSDWRICLKHRFIGVTMSINFGVKKIIKTCRGVQKPYFLLYALLSGLL